VITGEQVKKARKLLGWSQEDLAAHAGLSGATVGAFERGRRLSEHTLTACNAPWNRVSRRRAGEAQGQALSL